MSEAPSARHHWEYALVRALMAGLAPLPAPARRLLGTSAGRAYYRGGRARRAVALRNLRLAFPEKTESEIEAIARSCAENFGRVFFDFLAVTKLSRAQLEERVLVEGGHHYLSSVARRKGVFLLSAHFGNWEIGALAAGLLAGPISSVVRPLDNPKLEEELARRRGKFGNRVIAKKNAARQILREIRAGSTVAILIDQNVLAREAVFVPFFGRPAATSPVLALLQKKTDAAVVPVFCRPEDGGRYQLKFEPPVLLEQFPAADQTPEFLTACYTKVTEDAVRARPELWLWMHNRWRTRPPHEAT